MCFQTCVVCEGDSMEMNGSQLYWIKLIYFIYYLSKSIDFISKLDPLIGLYGYDNKVIYFKND